MSSENNHDNGYIYPSNSSPTTETISHPEQPRQVRNIFGELINAITNPFVREAVPQTPDTVVNQAQSVEIQTVKSDPESDPEVVPSISTNSDVLAGRSVMFRNLADTLS
jgi:hypothetical protein